ncbi:MAG: hypothetical protein K8T10_14835 [Candidatus Eremiobacteraeota bacterium]|nr:hypothetical protein [Candidatus Eremiobacteraeota bacterium]
MVRKLFDIASRINIHDIHQLEIKLEYDLKELQKINKYKVDVYMFIPRAININEHTYSKDEFYSDMHNYIRFKTPSFSFKLILDPDFERSPFYVLKDILIKPKKESDFEKKTIKELKLLGCMVRARFRDFRLFIERKLNKENRDDEYLLIRVENKINRGIRILEELRSLKESFQNNYPEQTELSKYFKLVEEFLSYLFEEEMIRIFRLLKQEIVGNKQLEILEEFFNDYMIREYEYRRNSGFSLIFDRSGKGKEYYIYQMGLYKKIVSSVLYLNVAREQINLASVHVIGSISAFTASIVYYLVASLISKQAATNSILFVILISFGYVFKDRVKDIVKILFSPRMLSFLPDHKTKIFDPSNEKTPLGSIGETVSFTDKEQVAPEILRLRNITLGDILPEQSPEEILVYRKELTVNTDAVQKLHTRTVNFTDIMRFNLQKFFLKMDDPEQLINYFDEELEQGTTTVGCRAYHINLVLKYSRVSGEKEDIKYERYRLVANKLGIQRVEFIDET